MPSTYTLNNGIELIGTGEQSGTWGDTTNTNLELLDTALDGQVTVTLASAGTSGSPNTLAISDGATSDGRNRMVIFDDSSDLGATAYVQLTPNDAEKIIYIRNSLSGSRSILLFQGTYNASNDYELPAGKTAVIYFDGAGTGAVAANVFNNAYFDSLTVEGVTRIQGGSPFLYLDSNSNTGTSRIYFGDVASDTVGSMIYGHTDDDLVITTGASERLSLSSTEVVFNEPGADVDFRVESNNNANCFFVDALNDRIGINTGTPSTPLDLRYGLGTAYSGTSQSAEHINIFNTEHRRFGSYLWYSTSNTSVGSDRASVLYWGCFNLWWLFSILHFPTANQCRRLQRVDGLHAVGSGV